MRAANVLAIVATMLSNGCGGSAADAATGGAKTTSATQVTGGAISTGGASAGTGGMLATGGMTSMLLCSKHSDCPSNYICGYQGRGCSEQAHCIPEVACSDDVISACGCNGNMVAVCGGLSQQPFTAGVPSMDQPSELQRTIDRCFWTDAATRATNANGKLTTLQRTKELLFSAGAIIGLAGVITLFGWFLISAPASLGVRAVVAIIILVGLWLLWKSVNWLLDAIGGQVEMVEGEPDLRSDVRYRGPSYYYARVGPTELRVPYSAWRVLHENKHHRWRFCYLPRMRRAVSISILS